MASRANAAGMMSFYLYVVTHEEMRRQLLAKNAQIYAAMAPTSTRPNCPWLRANWCACCTP